MKHEREPITTKVVRLYWRLTHLYAACLAVSLGVVIWQGWQLSIRECQDQAAARRDFAEMERRVRESTRYQSEIVASTGNGVTHLRLVWADSPFTIIYRVIYSKQ